MKWINIPVQSDSKLKNKDLLALKHFSSNRNCPLLTRISSSTKDGRYQSELLKPSLASDPTEKCLF